MERSDCQRPQLTMALTINVNWTKFAIATLIGGVVYFLLGWLIYGMLLMDVTGMPEAFKEVNEIGLSFGITLPIQRFRSKIDLAGFISKRGDLKTNALEETIVGLKFSISANELWFVNLED